MRVLHFIDFDYVGRYSIVCVLVYVGACENTEITFNEVKENNIHLLRGDINNGVSYTILNNKCRNVLCLK